MIKINQKCEVLVGIKIFQQRIENEKIISQTVGINKVCDRNGDKVLYEQQ